MTLVEAIDVKIEDVLTSFAMQRVKVSSFRDHMYEFENVNRNKADTGILLLLSSAFHPEEYRFVCGFHSQPSASFKPAQRLAQRGGRQDCT